MNKSERKRSAEIYDKHGKADRGCWFHPFRKYNHILYHRFKKKEGYFLMHDGKEEIIVCRPVYGMYWWWLNFKTELLIQWVRLLLKLGFDPYKEEK